MMRSNKKYVWCTVLMLWIVPSVAMDIQLQSEVVISEVRLQKEREQKDSIPLGFGISRSQKSIASSVSVVSAEELSGRMVLNPANALYGKLLGLTVMQSGGVSWSNDPTLLIRGAGTLGDASVLILVDGYERPLSSLSLVEIENIVVLKDAAALAMYGIRGANGVMLVTTKRGEEGRNKVTVDYERGLTKATRLPKMLDAYGYAQAVNQARANDGLSRIYSDEALALYRSGTSPHFYPNVNWQEEALRDFGVTNNFSASFQGKGKAMRHFSVLNYQDDHGLLKPVDLNEGYSTQLRYGKFNFRSNIDVNLTSTTLFSVDLSGNLRESQRPNSSVSGIMRSIYNTPANAFPVKTYNDIWGGSPNFSANPVAQIADAGFQIQQTRELMANAAIEQRLDMLLPGLVAEAALGYDNSGVYSEGKSKQYQYQTIALATVSGGLLDSIETNYGQDTELSFFSNLSGQRSHATVRGKLRYGTSWEDQSVDAMLVYQQDRKVLQGQSNVFFREQVAGNVHYTKGNRWFADAVLSYSGSSILPKGNRFGFFPAVALAWVMSEEDWFSDRVFTNLKWRGSWGMTGSDLVPQNISQSYFFNPSSYFFTANSNPIAGWREGRLPSENAAFETSTKANFGLETTLLNKLHLTLDVFYNKRSHILVESSGIVSSVIGAVAPLQSIGRVHNRGAEVGLRFADTQGDFSYYIDGQLSFARNKIVDMAEAYQPYSYLTQTGRRVGQVFGLEAVGFFENQSDITNSPEQTFSVVRPGDIKYKDQNNDGIIDANDQVALGYSAVNPEVYYATTLGVQYKGFRLDATFQGVANRSVMLNTPSLFWPLVGNTSISSAYENAWTPETAGTATMPRLTTLGNDNNFRPNSIWLANGSYFKLRSVVLAYDLPQRAVSKLKLANTRILLRGMDLFSIDGIGSVDPEAIGATYPIYATYSLGLQIGF